jgi:carboxymethylenebutenolidase
MKTFLLVLIIVVATGFAQTKKSCCEDTPSPLMMSVFSNDKSFSLAHPEPIPFTLTDGKGKMITYNTSDGKTGNGYEVKAPKETNKWILVFHEWYGLNDYIKKESEEWCDKLNVNVLAVDLYDGKVASNNEEAGKYVKEVDMTRSVNIIKGAIDYAGTGAVFGSASAGSSSPSGAGERFSISTSISPECSTEKRTFDVVPMNFSALG